MRRENGFTLIEVMVAIGLMAILMVLGGLALRQFWLTQALYGSRDEVMTEMRRLQERTVSESHPLAYGARFRVDSSSYDVVQYDANSSTTTTDDTCTVQSSHTLNTGTVVESANFAVASDVTTVCRTQIVGASTDHFVIFFSRGTATSGSISFKQPVLGEKTVGLTVSAMTGRIELSG